MQENIKDLLFLCIGVIGISFIDLWPVIFTYYTSFCYYKNHNTKVNIIYASYLFFMIGQLLGSFVFPYIFFVAGTTFILFVFALIEFITGFFAIKYVSFLAVGLVLFEKGILFQGITTASNIILSEKFKDGILKTKYVTTSRIVFSILLTFVCIYIVNPNNEP